MTKPTFSTTIHPYRFDLNDDDERRAYDDLRARLLAEPGRGHAMTAFGNYYADAERFEGQPVELDGAHLFDNQWNTIAGCGSESGFRLFDWAEAPAASKRDERFGTLKGQTPSNIRAGYYLAMTPEIVAARQDRHACGYCGAQTTAAEAEALGGFCDRCMGGPHLKSGELHLLRLLPVATPFATSRAPLTDAEAAALQPRYVEAQLHGNKARSDAAAAKARAKVEGLVAEAHAKAAKLIAKAEAEKAGKLWLLDRGLSVENVIYYDHTGRFHFGWQGNEGLSDNVVGALLEQLGEFPAPYDISTDPKGMHQGRKLSGD